MNSGEVLAERYRIENLVGRGGMGTVWQAFDLQSLQSVAVKLLSRTLARHPIARGRFLRESSTLAIATSPHIVEILDHGVDNKVGPYLVMPHLRGEDLDQRLGRLGPMSLEQFRPIASQVASALQRVHACGLVHRDLKPANVFLCDGEGHEPIVKILDFGAVKADCPLTSGGGVTAPGTVIGTLSRMSPEQVRGEITDHRTDIWGFALLAFEALTGFPAVHPDTSMEETVLQISDGRLPVPSEKKKDLPRSFDRWFRRSTDLDRERRFQSVEAQLAAFLQIGVGANSTMARTRPEGLGALPEVRPGAGPRIVEVDSVPRSFPPLISRRHIEALVHERSELPMVTTSETSFRLCDTLPALETSRELQGPVTERCTLPAPARLLSDRCCPAGIPQIEPGQWDDGRGPRTMSPPRYWPAMVDPVD